MTSCSVVSLLLIMSDTDKLIFVADEHKGQEGKQNAIELAGFDVLTVVNVKITVIWVVYLLAELWHHMSDGSNLYVEVLWKLTSQNNNIPFHSCL